MSASSGTGPVLNGLLQSDLDANGFKIVNLDLPGSGINVAPTIQHTTSVLIGDNTGNAVEGQPKTDFWDTTMFGGNGVPGLVPDPAESGTTKFLCQNATWAVPPGTAVVPTIVHSAAILKGDSGGNAVAATAKTDYWDTTVFAGNGVKGLVPDPAAVGTTKYLRQDGSWSVPPAASGVTIAVTSSVIKGDGAGGGVAATSGDATGDYVAPSTALGRILAATQTIAAGATPAVNWNTSTSWKLTLASNIAPTFSNATDGWDISIAITNTASNYAIDWTGTGETIQWPSGTPPTQTIGVKTDVYTFKKFGTIIQGSVNPNRS